MVSKEIGSDVSVVVEPRIAVVGIGGAGCNIAAGFYSAMAPVDTIAINTDKDALDNQSADKKIYICKAVTEGEGTKGDARLGKRCAKVHEDEIEKAVLGYDAVFIVAGMGGGTGTGAAAVVAEICGRNDIMTFTVAVNPFFFESTRITVAADGLKAVRAVCPGTFVVENDKIFDLMPEATMEEAMRAVNGSIRDFISKIIAMIPDAVISETESLMKNIREKIDRKDMPEVGDLQVSTGLKT